MKHDHIKAILFDKDGTLLDFNESWAAVNHEAALWAAANELSHAEKLMRMAGYDPDTGKTAAGSLYAAGNAAEIAAAWHGFGVSHTQADLRTQLDRIFLEGADKAVPVTGLRETVRQLKADGYFLGIASSDSEAAISRFVSLMGLSSCFSFLAGYDSGFGHKPTPGMVHAFCAKAGCSPAEIAVVGDNLHDLEMARAGKAGLAIAVLTGTSTRVELEPHADFCIPGIAALPSLLRGSSGKASIV